MPVIFESNDGSPPSVSESSSTERVDDESSAATVDAANNVPPAEVNQTDKINKFLLKSFLERMNNETLPATDENDASTERGDEREWQWRATGGRKSQNLNQKLNL